MYHTFFLPFYPEQNAWKANRCGSDLVTCKLNAGFVVEKRKTINKMNAKMSSCKIIIILGVLLS